ncbi:MAG: SIMPL domain-containing protein [Acidobacteria bacterium]|nr:SIMPL domain-containing protein [Acidobacteriota bacterium]
MRRFLVLLIPILALTVVASACTSGSSPTTGSEVVEVGASGGGVAVFPAEESPSGLTVNVTGRATMPSSVVFVIVVPEPRGFGPFPEGLTSNDRAEIKDSVQGLGIPDEDIDFPSGQIFSPFVSVVRVRVDATDLPGIGERVLEAVEDVAGRSLLSGLRFGVADCDAAFELAWTDALETAEIRAQMLAASASIELGPIISIAEGDGVGDFRIPVADPCDTESFDEGEFGTGFAPFDAEPQVEIEASLGVTYALAGVATTVPGITVVGKGQLTVAADEAYVVVAFESFGEFGPEQISAEDRSAVIDALTALGYEEDDIDIANQPFSGLQVVQVEIAAGELSGAGDVIVDAIEGVFGRSDLSGATFTHSDCEGLLATARSEALNAAVARATALASVAGVSLEGIQAISELDASPFSPVQVDPCDEDAPLDIYSTGLATFEAEPEMTLRSAVQVTMAIKASQ